MRQPVQGLLPEEQSAGLSLQMEIFHDYLWKHAIARDHLMGRYHHLVTTWKKTHLPHDITFLNGCQRSELPYA